jgi:hypothetical protein
LQLEDTFVLATKLELTRTAQHALAQLAANLSLRDAQSARQRRTYGRKRIKPARPHVGRAANDAEQLSGARVDLTEREMVRVGMRLGRDYATDDHVTQRLADRHDLIDRRAVHCKTVRYLLW